MALQQAVREIISHDADRERVVVINDGSTVVDNSSNTSDVESFAEEIGRVHPEYGGIIAGLELSDYDSTQDLLDALNDIITDSGNNDTEAIVITENNYTGDLYFGDLRDVAFKTDGSTQLTISVGTQVIMDNIYQPGFDGMVHLDLQDLVRANSGIHLPTAIQGDDSVIDGICHEFYSYIQLNIRMKNPSGVSTYTLAVYAFDVGAYDKMSDIDELDIPEDYLMPVSLALFGDVQRNPITAILEDAGRRVTCNSGTISLADENGKAYDFAPLFAQDIPVSAIPYRKGEPFRMLFQTLRKLKTGPGIRNSRSIVPTPVFRVVNGSFEQYLFLNKYGHYDNIAMRGALTYTPEYEIENARRVYTVERAKGTRNNLWTQNTGPLSKTTMDVLSELLLSPVIYRYIPGKSIRRIVIESPELTMSSRDTVHTASFKWRYVENNL